MGLLYYYIPEFLVSCFWQRNAKWSLPPLEQQGGANPGVPLLWGDSYMQLQSLQLGRVLTDLIARHWQAIKEI